MFNTWCYTFQRISWKFFSLQKMFHFRIFPGQKTIQPWSRKNMHSLIWRSSEFHSKTPKIVRVTPFKSCINSIRYSAFMTVPFLMSFTVISIIRSWAGQLNGVTQRTNRMNWRNEHCHIWVYFVHIFLLYYCVADVCVSKRSLSE